MCVLGVPRPASDTVFTSILSGWWGPSGYLYSRPLSPTNCPTAVPSTPARGLAAGSGASGGGDGRGGNARVNPAAQQPERIVGSSRAEQFPQIWGPVGPGTGSLHASPRLCVYIQLFRTRICARMVEWRRGAPSLVPPEKAQERTFSCTPARTLADGRGGGGGFSGVLPLCRCLRFSPTTVLPLRYTRGPWPIVSKAGAGESRSGEKRSGEHTP